MKEENYKAISDETIIAALMKHGTQRAAAAALGISEKTIYNRMNNAAFRETYIAARSDVLRAAVHQSGQYVTIAVATIASILQDNSVNAAVRLQAAQTIISTACKMSDQLQEQDIKASWRRDNMKLLNELPMDF